MYANEILVNWPPRQNKILTQQLEAMMKKTTLKKIIYTSIVLLIGVIFWLFLNKEQTQNWSTSWQSVLIQDINKIDSILIQENQKRLLLSKKDEYWTINHHTEALPNKMEKVATLMANLQLQGTAPSEIQDSLKQAIEKNGTKVFFFQQNQQVSGLTIGQQTPARNGSFVLLNHTQDVVILQVPGFSTNLSSYFSANESAWRSKILIRNKIEQIQSIGVMHKNKENSFRIEQIPKQGFFLYDHNGTKHSDSELKKYEIIQYFTYFSELKFEYSSTEMQNIKDSLTQIQPDYRFEIKNFEAPAQTINLYRKYNSDKNLDLNRMYALTTNQQEVVVVTFYEFDPILKEKKYFIAPTKP